MKWRVFGRLVRSLGACLALAYWYPTQQRVGELSAELKQLEKLVLVQFSDVSNVIPTISQLLASAQRTAGFPKRQIGQWLWIASRFRIHFGSKDRAAVVAGRALIFLGKRLNGTAVSDEVVRELNWVLESTVVELGELLPPDALRSCLSAEELALVEAHLEAYDGTTDFNEDRIRGLVKEQLSALETVSTDGHFSTLAKKIETLFGACKRAGKDGAAARSALLYLAHERDAVDDTIGLLGLLDDVYVIEWAYAVVENNTRCLPLLLEMLAKWPFVSDLAVIGKPLAPLDRFSQYVVCAALRSLFVEEGPTILVARDTAPYGSICALFAAIQAAKNTNQRSISGVDAWPLGQHITISDGETIFKAVYLGTLKVGNRQKYKIGVSGNGSITVDLNIMPYVARASAQHRRLSKGNDISIWLRGRHPDPFSVLTGTARQNFEKQDCVLLLCARHHIDEYISYLRPFGSSVPALFGINYITSDGRHHKLNDSTSDHPLIYATSDPETAFDLIREPPQHVNRWQVIVEGARLGRALQGIISSSGWESSIPLCILAALRDREVTEELLKQGIRSWYLEDHDVEVPPLTFERTHDAADPLVRTLKRQPNHWCVSSTIHDTRNGFLEAVQECASELASRARTDERTYSLSFTTLTFLQKAISQPIRTDGAVRSLQGLAKSIASQASVLRQYDPIAARVYELFAHDATEAPRVDRELELESLLSGVEASERIAVICRSANIAKTCEAAGQIRSLPRLVAWLNLEELRQAKTYDRIIVPGWLDKTGMRELFDCGYASRLELLLLPFEKKWHETARRACHRWERRLESRTVDTLRKAFGGRKTGEGVAKFWQGQLQARLDATVQERDLDSSDPDDTPEFERLDLRALEELRQSVGRAKEGQPSAKAQLVVFEDGGAYTYLPPGGKAIVLSTREGELDESKIGGGGAERMLFRSVADLEPGMVLALPLSNDRDLVDAKADQFMTNPAEVRKVSALWKDAIQRYLSASGNHAEFAKKMAKAGQPRDPATIKTWATQTHTIAPRNYLETVPLIARLTGDEQLNSRLSEVEQSIDLIYRARATAAEAIVKELFSGSIDLDSDELTFDLNGKTIRYALHRVRLVGDIHTVPIDMIGGISFMGALNLRDQSAQAELGL